MQLSDQNKILKDKSMLERYRKYKCWVFIDFEYTCVQKVIVMLVSIFAFKGKIRKEGVSRKSWSIWNLQCRSSYKYIPKHWERVVI